MKKILLLLMAIILAGCGKPNQYNIELPDSYISSKINESAPLAVWHITYSNGETIKASDVLGEKELIDVVSEKTAKYNTYSSPYSFTTTNQGIVDISGGSYGSVVDLNAEYEYVLEKLNNKQSESDRKPIFKKEMPDVGNSYVEISLSEQKVYTYLDGKLENETDCVTGTANTNRATSKGIFYISERINGKYLRGDNYCTWVNKWMRLTNSGVGLHDAGWRGKFGGNIYTYDGSHGCINLPPDFASWLFDHSFVGMPVFIY